MTNRPLTLYFYKADFESVITGRTTPKLLLTRLLPKTPLPTYQTIDAEPYGLEVQYQELMCNQLGASADLEQYPDCIQESSL